MTSSACRTRPPGEACNSEVVGREVVGAGVLPLGVDRERPLDDGASFVSQGWFALTLVPGRAVLGLHEPREVPAGLHADPELLEILGDLLGGDVEVESRLPPEDPVGYAKADRGAGVDLGDGVEVISPGVGGL